MTDKLTLDIDPDNEFNWSDDAIKSVYEEFDRLVDAADGEDLTDYNLRRIGSDLEAFHSQAFATGGRLAINLKSPRPQLQHGLTPGSS